LKVETWWNKALDRNIWGRIIKEAKVHTELELEEGEEACYTFTLEKVLAKYCSL
jgi:hypothetical protein